MPAVNAYLRRHEERDDRIEALISEVADLREEMAALRGTQDVLAMFKEKKFKPKFKDSLLQELREGRAKIDAKFLQELLYELGQV